MGAWTKEKGRKTALTFHKGRYEHVDEKLKSQADAALDALARRKAASRRTAWIIAVIAAGFFIASLVQGHLAHIPH